VTILTIRYLKTVLIIPYLLALECGACSGCIRGAWREERQLRLSWWGGYKASEMRVPAFGFSKGAALHAWGSVVGILSNPVIIQEEP
jgi:hypothetical protein